MHAVIITLAATAIAMAIGMTALGIKMTRERRLGSRIDAQTERIDHLADEVAGVKAAVDNLGTQISHVEHAA